MINVIMVDQNPCCFINDMTELCDIINYNSKSFEYIRVYSLIFNN